MSSSDALDRTDDAHASTNASDVVIRVPDTDERRRRALDVEASREASSRVARALACPCVADLRSSSCGDAFDDALTCYVSADEHERGKACVEQFVKLHACMSARAGEFEAFARALEGARDVRGEATVRESGG